MGHVASICVMNAYKILVRKLEGNGPLVRSKRPWEDNIKKDVGEIG
jgi:hypothetical protein